MGTIISNEVVLAKYIDCAKKFRALIYPFILG